MGEFRALLLAEICRRRKLTGCDKSLVGVRHHPATTQNNKTNLTTNNNKSAPLTKPSSALVIPAKRKVEEPSHDDLIRLAERTNPPLVKYLKRVLKEGMEGARAITEAMRRLNEADRSERVDMERAMLPTSQAAVTSAASARPVPPHRAVDEAILRLRRQPGPGIWAADGYSRNAQSYLGAPETAQLISLSSPLAGLINAMPTIMKNPKYHDYYLANMGHSLPIPYAATDGIANKTVGVRGSVSSAVTVPPGAVTIIVPTPDHYFNAPYVLIQFQTGVPVQEFGAWYGGISPQALLGVPPSDVVEANVDDRSLQFKGGLLELTASVAYNQSCIVGHLDPYATMGYGMALGLMQRRVTDLLPGAAYSAQVGEFPYFTDVATTNVAAALDMAVKTTLIGSSSNSGVSYRQIIRPFAHCFSAAVAYDVPNLTGPQLSNLGYPASLAGTDITTLSKYAQGMYVIDNRSGSSAVAIDMKMEMAYRVRVDNKAPAIYMSADSDTVPKHSIEFKPVTAIASSVANAASMQQSNASARALVPAVTVKPATMNHMADAVAVARKHEPSVVSKIADVVNHVPVVGRGVSTALRGGEKIATAGDAGDVFAGLFDIGRGAFDSFGSLFGF